jgi:hypothetical protein
MWWCGGQGEEREHMIVVVQPYKMRKSLRIPYQIYFFTVKYAAKVRQRH